MSFKDDAKMYLRQLFAQTAHRMPEEMNQYFRRSLFPFNYDENAVRALSHGQEAPMTIPNLTEVKIRQFNTAEEAIRQPIFNRPL